MRSRLAIAVALTICAWAPPAAAQPILADLSSHVIAISTDFTGTEVVLFGALEEPGNVAVVVRGPSERVVVRQKDRIAGIWVNRTNIAFDNVPSYYGVATNGPIETFADERLLERQEIGLNHLRMAPVDAEGLAETQITAFREALVRAKQREGVFPAEAGQVVFLGDRLFRTTISFPANVPTGQYQIRVFLIRDGHMVHATTTPLIISKIGVGALIFVFAQRYAAIYGLAAILIAVAAGWLASLVFRRG